MENRVDLHCTTAFNLLKVDIISACNGDLSFYGGKYLGRKRDEKLCPQGQGWKRDRSFHRESAQAGRSQGRKSRLNRYQATGAGHEEGAYIHRREGAGGQAQERAGLDEGQDLEAYRQENWRRKARRALKQLH